MRRPTRRDGSSSRGSAVTDWPTSRSRARRSARSTSSSSPAPAGSPYPQALARIDDPPGLGPIPFDIPMTRGISIEGRVVDEPDGKPVKAWVTYHVAADNPALDAAPDFRQMQYAQSYMLKAT